MSSKNMQEEGVWGQLQQEHGQLQLVHMILLLNYSKGKANCSKSKEVEDNCRKNIVSNSRRNVMEANIS